MEVGTGDRHSIRMNQITIFYDGACPLCVREISLLRRLDEKRNRIRFQDVSPPDAAEFCPIPQEKLLARFHVETEKGRIVDGAEAFTEAYGAIPWLAWVRPIGRFAPTRWVLNRMYDGFLLLRPSLQRFFRKRQTH